MKNTYCIIYSIAGHYKDITWRTEATAENKENAISELVSNRNSEGIQVKKIISVIER